MAGLAFGPRPQVQSAPCRRAGLRIAMGIISYQ